MRPAAAAVGPLLRSFGESGGRVEINKHTQISNNGSDWAPADFCIPPIGLSVYEMYGRSESEQTLIGGDAGRESDCCGDAGAPSDWPLTAIVLPRCRRAAVADMGRLCAPNGRWADDVDAPVCDAGPLRLPDADPGFRPLAPDAGVPDCDCSDPMAASCARSGR